MTKIIILDTETTGLVKPDPIEITYFNLSEDLNFHRLQASISEFEIEKLEFHFHSRFRPSKPIDAGASKVNGIYFKDVVHCLPCSEFKLPENTEYMIGHHIRYDHEVLKYPKVKLICTKELAGLAFPKNKELTSYKLTSLIEYLYPEQAKRLIATAHTSIQDCKLVYLLLIKILQKLDKIKNWEQLANLCSQGNKTYQELENPIQKELKILIKMPFGKYKDEYIDKIPKDYLKWLLKQSLLNKDLEYTINKLLGK